MAGDDCWSAGVLAGFDIGVLSSAVVLAGGDGERLTATMKNTGASTSAATDWRRMSAVPLRTRLKDTIAGITAMMHNRPPNAAVAGITASAAPDSDDECHRTQAIAWWGLLRGAHQGGPFSCCCSLADDAVARVTASHGQRLPGIGVCRGAVPRFAVATDAGRKGGRAPGWREYPVPSAPDDVADEAQGSRSLSRRSADATQWEYSL